MVPALGAYNFVNNGPLVAILVPLESPVRDLSNGTKIVKNGPLLTKLQVHKVGAIVQQFPIYYPWLIKTRLKTRILIRPVDYQFC